MYPSSLRAEVSNSNPAKPLHNPIPFHGAEIRRICLVRGPKQRARTQHGGSLRIGFRCMLLYLYTYDKAPERISVSVISTQASL